MHPAVTTMLTAHERGLGNFQGYYPMLATVVTSRSSGRSNAMAVAWHAIVSTDPPAYGVSISPKRFTHSLITESKSFCVNFLPKDRAELVAAVGGCSGRDIDKFKEFRIKTVDPLAVDVPVLEDAYAALECKVFSAVSCGNHDWFVGHIIASHYDRSAFDTDGVMNVSAAKPTAYMGNNMYLLFDSGGLVHLDRKECVALLSRR